MVVDGHLAGVPAIAEGNDAHQVAVIVNADRPVGAVHLDEVLRTDVVHRFPFGSLDVFLHGAARIGRHAAPVGVNPGGQRFTAVVPVYGNVLGSSELTGVALGRGRLAGAGEERCSGGQDAGCCSGEGMNVSHGNRNGYVIKEENTSHFKEKNAGSADLWRFLTFPFDEGNRAGAAEAFHACRLEGMMVDYSNFSRKSF